MNPYSFSVLVFAIGSIFMAIQILVRRRDAAGVIYFFLSTLYCVWGVGYALCISGSLSYDISLTSVRIANAVAAYIPITWLYFCLVYTRRMQAANWKYFLLYLIPVVVSAGAFSEYLFSGLRPIVGFKYYPIAEFLCNIHISIYFVVTPIGFYQLWKSIQNLSGEERSRQIKFLIVSFLGYLGGGLSFFPAYDIAIPQYGLFLLPLYPFGKAYFMGSSGLLFDEERLAQAAHKDKLAALGILTASINHEIRGPLFMLRGVIETETDINRAKEKILPQIERVTDIVSRLVHFAKKGVDEAAKMEPLDLKEVLLDIRPLFQHQLNYQHIEYAQDISANLPKVMADRRYLEEILFNLILNACQALRNISNPKIELSANVSRSTSHEPRATNLGRKRGSWSVDRGTSEIEISISDNGPGISPEQAKHIFKPFHTTKSEGTGLGLYITKQLVEKCSGKIEVRSEPGKGAKFIASFRSV